MVTITAPSPHASAQSSTVQATTAQPTTVQAQTPILHASPSRNPSSSSDQLHLSFLKTALDSLFDGILVIHPNGTVVHANGQSHRLFSSAVPEVIHLTSAPDNMPLPPPHPLQPLLDEIGRVCGAMMDNQHEFPNQEVILDSEVVWDDEAFRLRVRWMDLNIRNQPCLLITIEDLQQTAVNQVNVDRWKYKLTPREAEVWGLKRQGYSYKAIASTLFVSENTVKKHLKNIQTKRRIKDGLDARS